MRDWQLKYGNISGYRMSRQVSEASLRQSSSNTNVLTNNRSQNISVEDNIAKMYIDEKGKSKLDE